MSNDTEADILARAAAPLDQAEAEVRVTFDWQPTITDGCVRFHLILVRGEKRSGVTFEIRLDALTTPELERLNQFLVRRHLDMTTHDEIASTICWLIDCAICQSEPGLSLTERTERLRTLLLLPSRND